MRRKIIEVLAALVCSTAAHAAASAPAAVVSGGDVAGAMAKADPKVDPFLKTLLNGPMPGTHLSVDMLRRLKPEGHGLVHDRVTEIYEIKDGSGVLLSGGELINPTPVPVRADTMTIGPSRQSLTLKGGSKRHVGPGDIVVIPAGTPHEFDSIDGHVTYLVIRVDPGH